MKIQVQLAADQLIDYYSFCKAIAEGICPTDLKGIDCVVGKQTPVSAASVTPSCQENRSPLSESLRSVELIGRGNFKDQLSPNQTAGAESSTHSLPSLGQGDEVEEFSFPYKLSDEDRTLIEKLLPDLPALHFPFTEEDVTKFMNAYLAHPNRPAWKPILATAAHVEKLKADQHKAMVLHQKALLEELALGRLTAVNANHIPAKTLAPGVFIPRKEAIAYLGRCGMSHGDLEFDDTLPSHIKVSEAKSRAVGVPKFTAQQKKEIVKFHKCLKDKKDRKPTAKTAEKFKTSTSTVRKFVREAKKEEKDLKNALSGRVVKLR